MASREDFERGLLRRLKEVEKVDFPSGGLRPVEIARITLSDGWGMLAYVAGRVGKNIVCSRELNNYGNLYFSTKDEADGIEMYRIEDYEVLKETN